MLIEWYGHACFRLKLTNGLKITIDPFDETVGFPQPHIETDIALISHHHFDHSCADSLTGNYEIIDKPGEYEKGGIKISGVKTFHDKKKGALRGENIIFKIQAEGLIICHLGDLCEEITDELVRKIGHADVLMVPVGGVYTINAEEAVSLIDKLEPNIALPMHYRINQSNIPVDSIHSLIEQATGVFDVSKSGKNYLDISKQKLKKRTRIIILNTPLVDHT
ncbi:MAG: MBL fold metallo-hydrolase [Eubacteriales bacterium]